MRKDTQNFWVSHDPKDAACFTHKAKIVKSKHIGEVVGIIDDERKHYHFLRAWDHMEIDINNQWSINNGVMGLELELHKDGKNKVHYMVKLKPKIVEKILKTPLNCMAICSEGYDVLLHFKPLKVKQLFDFFIFKINTDKFVKEKHLSPPGWTID